MNRIDEAFYRCRMEGRGALVCYITAGFPTINESEKIMLACAEGGADILEIGVPFSDPVADGEAIQFSSMKAIEQGMVPSKAFEIALWLRERIDIPLVFMGYYNPIFRIGEQEYARLAYDSGVDGLIVPDLPIEEAMYLERATRREGLALIQLVGPTTSDERMSVIGSHSSGFLYLVSTLGTTGERNTLSKDVGNLILRAKHSCRIPIGVGFGISTQQQISQIISMGADAVIVGSAIVRRIIDGTTSTEICDLVQKFRGGCKKV